MKVCIFEPWYDQSHRVLLRALAEGIPGAEVHDVRHYVDCDVAVIFGMVKNAFHKTQSKAEIIRQHGEKPLLVMERGYVRRDEYFSLGWGGINGRADFCNDGMPGDRWDALGTKLHPWKSDGQYALVCGQVPWDVSVQDTDHIAWCRQTVDELLALGYHVEFRPHPYALERNVDYGIEGNARFDLEAHLDGALFSVTFNSNSAVDSVIAGVPSVAIDVGSMAWDVCSHSIEEMASGVGFEEKSREQWAFDLAYAQWTIDEFRSGRAWNHISRRRS